MRHVCAAFLALLVVCACARALAAPAAGIDCECNATGAYVLPIAPEDVPTANGITGATPLGKYVVSAISQGDGSAMVSIATAAAPTTIILSVPGASWGFSPDDDRFVIVHLVAGLPYATLYNLAGPTPATPIYETPDLAAGGYLSFSPHGRYALGMWLGPDADDFTLDVRDAVTGTQVHDDHFAFSVSDQGKLPTGDEQFDGVVLGFGPDDDDRSLVYAYTAGNGLLQNNWTLVNLGGPNAGGWTTPSNYGFRWGFSPCGDAFAVVTANGFTNLKEARLYSTFDFAQLGYTEYPITDTDSLSSSASSHIVQHALTQVTLAPNVADDSCGGAVTAPPSAAFTAPSTALTGLAIAFTDQSTTPQGQISSRHWTFGDGSAAYVADPTHTFASPGTYTVQLTVTSSLGRADTVSHEIVVAANQPPVASFSFAPMTPTSRDLVTFTSTSTDDDGVTDVYWQIGDVSDTGPVVQAKVCAPSVTVTMWVRDHAGQESMAEYVLSVVPSPELAVPAGGDLVLAAAAACPGETLVLAAGHYAGGVTLKGVNLRGEGAGATWIDGYGGNAEGWVLALEPAPYDGDAYPVSMSDVTVNGGGLSSSQGGGILIVGGTSVVLSDLEVADNAGLAGIYAYNNAGSIEIESANVHDNDGSGLWLDVCELVSVQRTKLAANLTGGASITESSDVLFAWNDVHDNSSSERWSGLALDVTKRGSVIGNRLYGNTSPSPDGVAVYLSGSVELSGNLVVANHAGGIYDDDAADISGTTIAHNCGTGLYVDGTGGGITTKLYNSIVYGNDVDVIGTLGADDANLIGTDPRFVANGDYHLAAGSPAIDQGDDSHIPVDVTHDGDGDARVLASQVDIGWDEWHAGQASDPVSAVGCNLVTSDAGVDAGSDVEDAGQAVTDAGFAPDSGVVPATDAGIVATADASMPDEIDASAAPGDASASADAGETRTKEAGCACKLASTQRSPSAPLALMSLLVLLVARRRSARPRAASCARGR